VNGQSNMGERGAVRSNSGPSVDHSDPGLREPTTPPTAERNSEACPPYSVVNTSQHKSGRESESGALSGVRGASAVLRSEGTQQGLVSSLDKLKNNRNKSLDEREFKKHRNRNCGISTLSCRKAGDSTVIMFRSKCKVWSCEDCGPKKAKLYKHLISEVAEREGLNRFLTLTLDPSKITGDSTRYLRLSFNKFRTYIRRRYGAPIKYIAILEFTQQGIAHLHVLVDRFIEQKWISESWSAVGGGKIVDIRWVDIHRVSHYLAKYLTKDLLLSAPKRARRVTTSRSIRLVTKTLSELEWKFHKHSIFRLFSWLSDIAKDVQNDQDGFLCSFAISVE